MDYSVTAQREQAIAALTDVMAEVVKVSGLQFSKPITKYFSRDTLEVSVTIIAPRGGFQLGEIELRRTNFCPVWRAQRLRYLTPGGITEWNKIFEAVGQKIAPLPTSQIAVKTEGGKGTTATIKGDAEKIVKMTDAPRVESQALADAIGKITRSDVAKATATPPAKPKLIRERLDFDLDDDTPPKKKAAKKIKRERL